MKSLRKNLGTIAVAGVTAFVVAAGPAIATTTVDLARNALALGGKPASAYLLKTTAAQKYLTKTAAAGTYVAKTGTAANADRLDSVHADQLDRIASAWFTYPSVDVPGTIAEVNITTTAPVESIRASASFWMQGWGSPADYPCERGYYLAVDGAMSAGPTFSRDDAAPSSWSVIPLSLEGVISVGPGDHTVALLQMTNGYGSCVWSPGIGSITAETALFGGDGQPPSLGPNDHSRIPTSSVSRSDS